MKERIIRRLTQCLLLASPVALMVCRLEAAELNLLCTNLPPVDFHGTLSQGFLYSDIYNYLDTDTKDGSFRYSEAGVNASMNPFPRAHITIQGFMFDVGDAGEYQPFLDYASIDYTFNDYIGVRGGRIRKPGGIYNAIQDIDLSRTYVMLPQGIYDARPGDLDATLDVGEIFGTLPLSKAGDLSYEAYGGYQKDLALSVRFDPKPWWIFKVEGHYIHGTGLLDDDGTNPSRNGDGWFMLAVKTTFSF